MTSDEAEYDIKERKRQTENKTITYEKTNYMHL